jgi:peptidoglycan/LPS O-acetylase OafA/YrhL
MTARQSDRIPTLDGFRAIAILMVIVSHTVDVQSHPALVHLGHIGVLVFFSLSGYLITDRLLAEYRSTGAVSLRNFYLRRAFRILPPAVTFLGIVAILSQAGLLVCSFPAIRAALLFYTNFADFGDVGWRVGHFWSLSVEEHFYLLWPALLLAVGVRKGWRTALILAVSVCAWRLIDNHFHFVARALGSPYLDADSYRTDLMADVLLWGCCLAFYLRSSKRIALNAIASTSIAVSAAACLVFLSVGDIGHVTPLLHLLPAIILGAVVSCPTAPIGQLLELAPLKFVGKLSYSLYIWQQLFLGGPGLRLPLMLALAAAFACAYLIYRLVEQPCMQLGREMVQRGKKLVAVPETV